MGKKKIEEEPQKAILVMESELFKQVLEQRIEAGEKLLEIKPRGKTICQGGDRTV